MIYAKKLSPEQEAVRDRAMAKYRADMAALGQPTPSIQASAWGPPMITAESVDAFYRRIGLDVPARKPAITAARRSPARRTRSAAPATQAPPDAAQLRAAFEATRAAVLLTEGRTLAARVARLGRR